MENPQPVNDKPRSRKIWFIIAGVVLACCVIVAIGAVFAGPVVSSAIQGFIGTPGAEAIATALPSDQGLNTASPEAPSTGPVAGTATRSSRPTFGIRLLVLMQATRIART